MGQKVSTILTGIETFEGTSARGPWTKTVFKAADGSEYQTFEGAVASKASSLLNQPVEVTFTPKQRGQYTNLQLDDVAIVVGAANGAPGTPPPAHPPVATAAAPQPSADSRQYQIMRQSALERAIMSFAADGVEILGSLPELYELADQFVVYFTTHKDYENA